MYFWILSVNLFYFLHKIKLKSAFFGTKKKKEDDAFSKGVICTNFSKSHFANKKKKKNLRQVTKKQKTIFI